MKIICKAVGNGKQQNQERSILSEIHVVRPKLGKLQKDTAIYERWKL